MNDIASSKEYLVFILDKLSEIPEISYRAIMGEYILYYHGKLIGGIYDNRFLIKPTKSATALLPEARLELPYDGAKKMLLVDHLDDKALLSRLLQAVYEELPEPKKKRN